MSYLLPAKRDIKMIFIGDSSVGKSCIINKYIKGQFSEEVEPTVGASFFSREMEIRGEHIVLNIWDTAGQEAYRYLVPMYYRNADIAIVVFDLTKFESFQSVEHWVEDVRKSCNNEVSVFICGNKCDLEMNRAISPEQIQAKEIELKTSCIETSALTGQGLDKLFAFSLGSHLEQNPKIIEDSASPFTPNLTTQRQHHCC
ncbi:small GTP-binding protein, putative [Trichomonas vaginalis G3]|uniref:Small GTP-binding protein, putative n=1 Tax=Trichomonas vaginalis (strain ATCC PRA-98 / G3) TaxID=412133 RepID=A2G3Z0_TRIV3|nr:retrograde vesicle-mediated transport, Golgi to ER [Trichomonas vaginalis G3]EAX88124.1 small GTP-binding protein, putative [Trichomonas vaginalis G3]KAI5551298.1 retrograde vesicle-mediated transport, Golgi to ER [Trichomonas vaginalis G3]|eukprot:XP_001301054.1 small GTP-binding protein [Trichomonas vaginalis G3]